MTTAELDRRDATSALHHGRHDRLISTAKCPEVPKRGLDAIIVPTGRTAPAMDHAIALAAKLRCTLVALCSQRSKAADVERIARRHKANAIVIDLKTWPPDILPNFATSELLAGTPFSRATDTSQKRNLGLLLACLTKWERVVFLDDDIVIPNSDDLLMAARLAEDYAGVGIEIDPVYPSFPDNSVVCHAYRDAGGDQGMFIGGGALAVGAESMNSFFPNIYNEDWFFLLNEEKLRPVTMTGRARQRPYDPYLRSRAQAEELGDCLAEGLFWLLDAGRTISDADERYWGESLDRRRKFIAEVRKMVTWMEGDARRKLKMYAALHEAERQRARIEPKHCANYVAAWRRDRERWRRHVDEHQQGLGDEPNVEKVVSSLGLAGQTRFVTPGV